MPNAALTIMATCLLAGPAIGLLFMYATALIVSLYAVGSILLSEAPSFSGAGLMGAVLFGSLLVLPVFAIVGMVLVSPLTAATGLTLTAVHYTNVAGRASNAFRIHRSVFEFLIGAVIGCTYAFALGYQEYANIYSSNPFGIHHVSGFAAGMCNLIASKLINQNRSPRTSKGTPTSLD